jgi:dihydrofolate reductase
MGGKKVILYIAASLDGYIARTDDDISWLDAYQSPDEDYGFADFMKTIGTAIMGARTYEQSLKFPERTISGIKSYVLTRRPLSRIADTDVEFYNGDLETLVAKINKESTKDIWLVGGGKAVASFLNAGLVDEALHFVVPVLLKRGIPLYSALGTEVKLTLVESIRYPSGIVKLHYIIPHDKATPLS